MPELPEVETVVRGLRPRLVGLRIKSFTSHWPKQVSPDRKTVAAALAGRTVTAVSRRAKYIVWTLDDGSHLLVHLRMSGSLEFADEAEVAPRHVRAVWTFRRGPDLLFDDARKFGRIVYTRDLPAATRRLGVEPLERSFTAARLRQILTSRARRLKPLLLDQSVIAGLGNIYTDEALFRAGIHPLARSDRLRAEQIVALRRAIRTVLTLAIRHNGTTFDWVYPEGKMQERLLVYGRAGEPCRRCGTAIQGLRVGQRGTHVCPKCQPQTASEPRP